MKRYKGNIGKFIGGKLYVAEPYAAEIIPDYAAVRGRLTKACPDLQFNVVVWDTKKQTVRFCTCNDFDEASEPMVGYAVTFSLATLDLVGVMRFHRQIYHRKHLMVRPDYSGFDVLAAERWADLWSSKLAGKETADGSSRPNWLKQISRHGLTLPS